MNFRAREIVLSLALLVVMLGLGAFEGVYGRGDYSQDAICYLTLAKAIHTGEWRLAANSVWSIGYPALIQAFDTFRGTTPLDEWKDIHRLNLAIFAVTFFSFLFLLSSFSRKAEHADQNRQLGLVVLLIVLAVFLTLEISVERISRVSPDMLVSCLFFLSAGMLLRIQQHATYLRTLLLGLLLGVAFLVKAIFLPISLTAFIVLGVMLRRHDCKLRMFATTGAGFLLFAAPYCTALSWSMGHFTTGTTGAINYATNVEGMPGLYWQGGPETLGEPLHPVRKLFERPAMYAFGEPFHVPYSPMFERFYFVQGFKTIAVPRRQIHAVSRNLQSVIFLLFRHPLFDTWLLILAILFLKLPEQRRPWLREIMKLWPCWSLALLSIVFYLLVVVEPRYLPGFLIVLIAVPLLALLKVPAKLHPGMLRLIVVITLFGSLADLASHNLPVIVRAMSNDTIYTNRAWKLGLSLAKYGLAPGDRVGTIVHNTSAYATWAYVGGVNIVAELIEPGRSSNPRADDYEADYWDYPAESKNQDPTFWQLPSDKQRSILQLFRQAGATAVVSLSKPTNIPAPSGWIQVQETGSWIYRF